MSSDLIADMLAAIKNGGAAKKKNIEVAKSKINIEILKVLQAQSFIKDFTVEGNKIKITLEYFDNNFAIVHLKRISKSGVRVYTRKKDFNKKGNREYIGIISTSQGIMTSKEARAKKLGGEILCQVA